MRAHSPMTPLALILLVAPHVSLSPVAAQEPNPALVRPGRLALELSASIGSSLGVNRLALESALCGEPIAGGGERGGSAEDCHLVVGGKGGQYNWKHLELSVDEAMVFPCNEDVSAIVSARPSELALVGWEPFVSSCGRWFFDVELDRGGPQQRSILYLHTAESGTRVGLAAGTLHIAALLRFHHADSNAEHLVPLTLELDLAGRWTVLDARATPAGESNFSLFLDDTDGLFVARAACAKDKHPYGLLCFEALPERLDALNY